MRITLKCGPLPIALDLKPEDGGYRVTADGAEHYVESRSLPDGSLVLEIDGRRVRLDLVRDGNDRLVAVAGEVYRFTTDSGASARPVTSVASPEVTAPMPGKITQLPIHAGDRVDAGTTLAILEAMKMETRVAAEAKGTVVEIRVAEGEMVEGGQVLVVLRYDDPQTSDDA